MSCQVTKTWKHGDYVLHGVPAKVCVHSAFMKPSRLINLAVPLPSRSDHADLDLLVTRHAHGSLRGCPGVSSPVGDSRLRVCSHRSLPSSTVPLRLHSNGRHWRHFLTQIDASAICRRSGTFKSPNSMLGSPDIKRPPCTSQP